MDTSVIYSEVRKNPYGIYSFLLVAGYLKIVATYPQNDGNFMYDVAIPNKEITFVCLRKGSLEFCLNLNILMMNM